MADNALSSSSLPNFGTELLADIRQLIDETRNAVAVAVNSGLTTLYWQIGRRIQQEVLNDGRADYGDQIVESLAQQLTAEYGRGFTAKSLRHMIRFAEIFLEDQIVSAARRQLSWTHFKTLIYIDDPLKRDSIWNFVDWRGGVRALCKPS